MYKKISEINTLNDIKGISNIKAIDLKSAQNFIMCLAGDRDLGEILLNNMDDNQVMLVYKQYRENLEKRIDEVIYEKCGQKRIPVGTRISFNYDFDDYKKGDEAVIEEVTRFDEDTFGQGWYIYTVGGQRLYASEFTVVES